MVPTYEAGYFDSGGCRWKVLSPVIPLRVAVDCSHLTAPGGIRAFLVNLLPALAVAAPEVRYTFYVRGRQPAEIPPLPEGVLFRNLLEGWPRRILDRLQNLAGRPRIEYFTGPIDVYHGTHFYLPPTRDARCVLTLHDLTYLRHPEYYQDSALNDYGYRYLLGHSLKRAQHVACDSRATQDDLRELFPEVAERSSVVHLGIDPSFRKLDANETAPLLDEWSIDRRFALFPVGSTDARKNIDRTLEAFAKAFPDRGERPLLVLTGHGKLGAAVESRARELDISADVRALTVSYPDGLMALMSAASWGLYPSLYEGFGLPPLEMMACELAVMVSDLSSMPEVVGDAGLLVNPLDVDSIVDAMRALDGDASLREKLSMKGVARARSEAASWGRCARQMMAIYREDWEALAAEPSLLD